MQKDFKYKFERIEKKFWMRKEQYEALLPLFDERFEKDSYGEALICSIYYDTPDFYLIRRSIERPFFKEKIRIRSYGLPEDGTPVFLEIKRKLDGIGYKRRMRLSFKDAKALLKGQNIGSDNPQIEKEILELVKRYNPVPAVFLSYKRYAMTGKENPDLRITIDRDLMFRRERVEDPDDTGLSPIMDDETLVLMEIKAVGSIPLWMTEELSRLHIYQAPFSKIGTCYVKHIAGENK
ncbi:MAG: polyphosphate polymerase domain-containing protein [Parasporobacterium sp.]|nr:polyphosphate polymerase domain-containing protein [Parasporobacterium sp.]